MLISSRNKYNQITFWFLGSILFLVSAFRPYDFDNDAYSYVELFNGIGFAAEFIEPTFRFISFVIHNYLFDNVRLLFLVYALLGVYLKLYAIRKYSDYYLISLLIYYSNLFLFQEMTQIRVGVGCAILLLSIKPLLERNLVKFLLIVFVASLFHYSLLISLCLYLFNSKHINVKAYCFFLILIYSLDFFGIHFASLMTKINLPFLDFKISTNPTDLQEIAVNTRNFLQIFKLIVVLIMFKCWKVIAEKNCYSVIIIKIYFLSLISFVIFADSGIYAFRISQMFNIVEPIILTYFLYIIKSKLEARFIVCCLGIIMFFITIYTSSNFHVQSIL